MCNYLVFFKMIIRKGKHYQAKVLPQWVIYKIKMISVCNFTPQFKNKNRFPITTGYNIKYGSFNGNSIATLLMSGYSINHNISDLEGGIKSHRVCQCLNSFYNIPPKWLLSQCLKILTISDQIIVHLDRKFLEMS